MRGALAKNDGESLEEHLPVFDEMCEVFMTEYEKVMPLSRERVFLWEALDLLTNVLHNWTKVRPERLGGTIALLEWHLEHGGLGEPALAPSREIRG